MSPFISDGCHIRRKDLETHRDIEGQVKMKAEMGMMLLNQDAEVAGNHHQPEEPLEEAWPSCLDFQTSSLRTVRE